MGEEPNSALQGARQAPTGAGERPAVSVVPDDLHALRAVVEGSFMDPAAQPRSLPSTPTPCATG
jgi:hypothetical protein